MSRALATKAVGLLFVIVIQYSTASATEQDIELDLSTEAGYLSSVRTRIDGHLAKAEEIKSHIDSRNPAFSVSQSIYFLDFALSNMAYLHASLIDEYDDRQGKPEDLMQQLYAACWPDRELQESRLIEVVRTCNSHIRRLPSQDAARLVNYLETVCEGSSHGLTEGLVNEEILRRLSLPHPQVPRWAQQYLEPQTPEQKEQSWQTIMDGFNTPSPPRQPPPAQREEQGSAASTRLTTWGKDPIKFVIAAMTALGFILYLFKQNPR